MREPSVPPPSRVTDAPPTVDPILPRANDAVHPQVRRALDTGVPQPGHGIMPGAHPRSAAVFGVGSRAAVRQRSFSLAQEFERRIARVERLTTRLCV